jgi:hypothetical protein
MASGSKRTVTPEDDEPPEPAFRGRRRNRRRGSDDDDDDRVSWIPKLAPDGEASIAKPVEPTTAEELASFAAIRRAGIERLRKWQAPALDADPVYARSVMNTNYDSSFVDIDAIERRWESAKDTPFAGMEDVADALDNARKDPRIRRVGNSYIALALEESKSDRGLWAVMSAAERKELSEFIVAPEWGHGDESGSDDGRSGSGGSGKSGSGESGESGSGESGESGSESGSDDSGSDDSDSDFEVDNDVGDHERIMQVEFDAGVLGKATHAQATTWKAAQGMRATTRTSRKPRWTENEECIIREHVQDTCKTLGVEIDDVSWIYERENTRRGDFYMVLHNALGFKRSMNGIYKKVKEMYASR